MLKEFGRLEFSNIAYLNCKKNESAKTLFQDDFDVHLLIRGISALTKVDIKPETTLIVLDEIQEVPRASEPSPPDPKNQMELPKLVCFGLPDS